MNVYLKHLNKFYYSKIREEKEVKKEVKKEVIIKNFLYYEKRFN